MKRIFRTFGLFSFLVITAYFTTDVRSDYSLPMNALSVFATNLYHDGFNDLLIGNETLGGATNPTITILKNIDWGIFEITDTSKIYCGMQNNIFAVDVNNDGWEDIVSTHATFSGTNHYFLRIYYNENGIFPNDNFVDFNLNTSSTIDGVSYGDINGDGYIDLLVFSHNSGFWDILYNDGTGYFSSPVNFNFPPTINNLICGDLNGDGRDDIVVCGFNTIVYFSYPSGFQAVNIDPSAYIQGVHIVDFDLDGKKDILSDVYIALNNSTILRMFKNMGNNSFQQLPDIIFNCDEGGLVVNENTDLNNDGYPDLIYSTIGRCIIWYNQGNFQIADSQFVAFPDYGLVWGYGVVCADLDNNGYNDIVRVQSPKYQNKSYLDIMFNDGQGHFVPDPFVCIHEHEKLSSIHLQNWPNPFQDETIFNFSLNEIAEVELSVYDLQGKYIKCLINQKLEGGSHSIKWRGLDNGDQPSKPGAFIAYLKVNGKICQSIKLIKT
jgi:hypothetical protein